MKLLTHPFPSTPSTLTTPPSHNNSPALLRSTTMLLWFNWKIQSNSRIQRNPWKDTTEHLSSITKLNFWETTTASISKLQGCFCLELRGSSKPTPSKKEHFSMKLWPRKSTGQSKAQALFECPQTGLSLIRKWSKMSNYRIKILSISHKSSNAKNWLTEMSIAILKPIKEMDWSSMTKQKGHYQG